MIDEPEEPDECENGFDDAKDTGREEAGVGTSDTNRAEDGWTVVVYRLKDQLAFF